MSDFEIREDNNMLIRYNGESKIVTIPNYVTCIGPTAFNNCKCLERIIIGNHVESISDEAFNGCVNLKYNEFDNALYLGDSHNPYRFLIKAKNKQIDSCIINQQTCVIAMEAFAGCKNLAVIVLPSCIKIIEDRAFKNCKQLLTIQIECKNFRVGYEVFNGCNNLQYTKFDGARYLGDDENPYKILLNAINKNIQNCTIHTKTIAIAATAFSGCEYLSNIIIPNSVFSIESEAFFECKRLNSLVLLNGLNYIGIAAFGFCENLINLELPKSVENIKQAFIGCSALQKIKVEKGNAHYFSEKNCLINRDENALILGCKNSCIPANKNIRIIDNQAFADCYDLEHIDIPEGVSIIKYAAFVNCYGLESITFPNSLRTIADSAFACCDSLKSIILPYGVTSIRELAFDGCSNMEVLKIPQSILSIEDGAFAECCSLEDVTMPIRFRGCVEEIFGYDLDTILQINFIFT